MKPELEKNSEMFDLNPDIIIKLFFLHTKFLFQDQYFKQKFGLGIRNPLNPVLSNLYLEFFEEYLLSAIKDQNIVWFKYIDDILCLWPVESCLEDFMDKLNNLECKVPFLDDVVHRIINFAFKYSVYRKTTSNIYCK